MNPDELRGVIAGQRLGHAAALIPSVRSESVIAKSHGVRLVNPPGCPSIVTIQSRSSEFTATQQIFRMAHIRKQDVIVIWQACDSIDRAAATLTRMPADGEDPTAEQLAAMQSAVLEIRALLPERPLRDLLSGTTGGDADSAGGEQPGRSKKTKAKKTDGKKQAVAGSAKKKAPSKAKT